MKNARLIIAIVLSIVSFACTKSSSTKPATSEEQVMCTQDAMQCPDGSWVGRTGPACAFVCPVAAKD